MVRQPLYIFVVLHPFEILPIFTEIMEFLPPLERSLIEQRFLRWHFYAGADETPRHESQESGMPD